MPNYDNIPNKSKYKEFKQRGLIVEGNIITTEGGSYDIGSSNFPFKKLYVDNICVDSITLSGSDLHNQIGVSPDPHSLKIYNDNINKYVAYYEELDANRMYFKEINGFILSGGMDGPAGPYSPPHWGSATLTHGDDKYYTPSLSRDYLDETFMHRSYLQIVNDNEKVAGGVLHLFHPFYFPIHFEPDIGFDAPQDNIMAHTMIPEPSKGEKVFIPINLFPDESGSEENVVRIMNLDNTPCRVYGVFYGEPGPDYPSNNGYFDYTVGTGVLNPGQAETFIKAPGPEDAIGDGTFGSFWFALPYDYTYEGKPIAQWLEDNRSTPNFPIFGNSLKKIIGVCNYNAYPTIWNTSSYTSTEGWSVTEEIPTAGSYTYHCLGVYNDFLFISNSKILITNLSTNSNVSITAECYPYYSSETAVPTIITDSIAPQETYYIDARNDFELPPFFYGRVRIISNFPIAVNQINSQSSGDAFFMYNGHYEGNSAHKWLIPLIGDVHSGWSNYTHYLPVNIEGNVSIDYVLDTKVEERIIPIKTVLPGYDVNLGLDEFVVVGNDARWPNFGYAVVKFYDDNMQPMEGFVNSHSIRWEGPAQASVLYSFGLKPLPID